MSSAKKKKCQVVKHADFWSSPIVYHVQSVGGLLLVGVGDHVEDQSVWKTTRSARVVFRTVRISGVMCVH